MHTNLSKSSLSNSAMLESGVNTSALLANMSEHMLDNKINQNLRKIEVLVMTIEFILAFFGNLIVVATLLLRFYIKTEYRKNKLSRMNFFILHLSIADIYVSLGNILTMLIWRRNVLFFAGDIGCRLVVYFHLVTVYYSTYVLITMSIDRYQAVCKPLISLSWTKKRGNTMIAVAFVIAHLQGIPQIVFFSFREIPGIVPRTLSCYAIFNPPWLETVYIVYTWVMQFLIPLCIIIVCYVSISMQSLHAVRNNIAQRNGLNYEMSLMNNNASVAANPASLITPRKKLSKTLSFEVNKSNLLSTSSSANQIVLRRHCTKNVSVNHKNKTIKLTLTVIILYAICVTPYYIGVLMNTLFSNSLNNIMLSNLKVFASF